MLAYKMFERNKIFYKISRWQPTTIVCSACGGYHRDVVNSLSVREWTCPDCNTKHDRDTNAAKNIKTAGI